MPKPAAKKTALAPKPSYHKQYALLAAGVLLMAVLIVLIVARIFGQPPAATCQAQYHTDKVVQVGAKSIYAETASTPAAQQQGLGGRACIGQDQAMLFVFKSPGQYSFWMKDMKFPIDIVWIGPDHKTLQVLQSVQPSSYPHSFAIKGNNAQYVLELAAGRSQSLGLKPGTLINW